VAVREPLGHLGRTPHRADRLPGHQPRHAAEQGDQGDRREREGALQEVQPVLLGAERSEEEAAWTLGASRWKTFWKITLPEILPAVLTGALLCFARALGEFGSIVIVAGNIPGRTLTAPVYIYGEIESQNSRAASAVSIVLLTISFAMLVLVDAYSKRSKAAGG